MFQVKFADIGEGIHEGVVFKLYVNKDGEIGEGESLMAIETDKVTADIPSPVTGKVVKIDWKPGDRIEVGQTIALIDDGKVGVKSNMTPDPIEDLLGTETQEPHVETVEEQGSTSVVGEIEVSSELIASSSEGQEKTSVVDKIKKVLATPVARKMAKDLGVDIKTVQGSGPAGRVLKADIQKAFDERSASPVSENEAPRTAHTASQPKAQEMRLEKDTSIHGHPSYVPSEPEEYRPSYA